eukprot:351462-Chlamydomonas_euryale.AAC.2
MPGCCSVRGTRLLQCQRHQVVAVSEALVSETLGCNQHCWGCRVTQPALGAGRSEGSPASTGSASCVQ